MNKDHSVIFEVAPKYCISDSFVYYEGYSISSMGFLGTIVDIMVIWIKFAHSYLLVHWFLLYRCYSCHLLLDHIRFMFIHEPNTSGSYAILFFTAWAFTSITWHIHNAVSFLLWPSRFILSGAIRSCTPLFSSSTLDTFQPGGTHLLVSYLFAFLWSPCISHSNYTGVVCHSLLQWIMFCQNSP